MEEGSIWFEQYPFRRLLEDEEESVNGETWEMIYVGVVLFLMFVALLSDRIGVSLYLTSVIDSIRLLNLSLTRFSVSFTVVFSTNIFSIFQADLVMLAALTACMAANIVTVSEGVSGFSNEGVLTVLVSF